MSQLSAENLPDNISRFYYDRDTVTSGIVHFGIGNFHRAHQAVYVDDLLKSGANNWGITGVSLRSPAMRDALKPQDYLYTLTTLSETTEHRLIGAIKNVLVAPENPDAVTKLIAQPTTQLMSSTITEKGYYLASGQIDFEHDDLKAELAHLNAPKTIYGFLTSGIIARAKSSPSAKLTVMCCDNISKGGEWLRQGTEHLLQRHDKSALNWAQDNVSFISSMVDRVCPATDDGLRDLVFEGTKRRDAWPVSAEPFTQWIIEDNFAGKRPDFDRAGAVFVDDIAPFERMKLRYLNAAHTIASTLGYLNGDSYVHEAIDSPEIFNFMRGALYENVLPYADVPQGYDGASYIESVIKRFQNSHLPYGNLQVGTDSSQKIQQRWFPTINLALSQNSDCNHFAFSLAAWTVFIQSALDNDVLNDPKHEAFKDIKSGASNTNIEAYLNIANADKFAFSQHTHFMKTVHKWAEIIKTNGIKPAIIKFSTP